MARSDGGYGADEDSSLSHLAYLPEMPDPDHSSVDLRPRSTQSEREGSLIQVAIVLLQQGVALLKHTVVTDDQYSRTSEVLPGSSVGKHLRHILDHYRLLLDADEVVNYDVRSRDVPVETRRKPALEAMKTLLRRFEQERDNCRLHKPLLLMALTPEAQELETTFGRELWFSSLHAIHHFSLIRVIIVGELGLEVPSDFGVAPSTLAFRAWSEEERNKKGGAKAHL